MPKVLPAKRRSKKRRPWFAIVKKIVFWLCFIVFWGFVIWTLLFSSVMKVEAVNVDNKRVDRNQVQQVIQDELQGAYWGMFPKNNLLLIPKSRIEAALRERFNMIKTVTVSRVFPKAVLVQLQERESALVWCHGGQCYLVDEQGTVFYQLKPTDAELSDEQLILVEDKSQTPIETGKKMVDETHIKFLLLLPAKSEEHTGVALERKLFTPSAMSAEVRAKTKEGWEIFFNMSEPLERQLGILKKVVEEKVGRERTSQLEYIDLRLKERVVYKLKQAEESEEEGEEGEKESESEQKKEAGEKKEKETAEKESDA